MEPRGPVWFAVEEARKPDKASSSPRASPAGDASQALGESSKESHLSMLPVLFQFSISQARLLTEFDFNGAFINPLQMCSANTFWEMLVLWEEQWFWVPVLHS